MTRLGAIKSAAEGRLAYDMMLAAGNAKGEALSDGAVVTLRQTSYCVVDAAYGDLGADAMLSPRIAPQMIGLGLLEAIPATDMLARVDERDADGDGISGRAAIVISTEFGVPMLGRFGFKGGAATIKDPFAGAFAGDMGLGTPLHPDPPKFVTNRLQGQPEQSFQLIWPYTDLLLHDTGEGLADNRPEGRATAREWKTPPLWGIGLTAQVSGHTQFLHDGRARNLLEAILWHGGEAEAARDAVIALPRPDREALLAFLNSL